MMQPVVHKGAGAEIQILEEPRNSAGGGGGGGMHEVARLFRSLISSINR